MTNNTVTVTTNTNINNITISCNVILPYDTNTIKKLQNYKIEPWG